MKKTLILATLVTGLSFAGLAEADHKDRRYYDNGVRYERAKVVHVEPISGYSESRYPAERCYRTGSDRDRRKGSIVGAVVGSVIGYKLGDDRGDKRIGSVAGAVVGSAIGQSVADKKSRGYRCEVVEERYGHAAIIGYNVTYRYKGRHYTTFMDYDPGRWVDVEVSVRPSYRGYRH